MKYQIKGRRPVKLLWLLLACIILLFTVLIYPSFFNTKPIEKIKDKVTESNEVATDSAKPAPIKVFIPAQSGKSARVPILMYHYIANNPNPTDKARDSLSVVPDEFTNQMKFLATNGFNAISFDTLYAFLKGDTNLPPKPVIITFDDGYEDFYLNAYPILRQFGLRSVVFIPTGLVGQGYYMNWDQIREIDSSGLVSFQAHSITHPNLTTISDTDLQNQITQSKKILESQLGKIVNTFAYPYGISDQRVWQMVKTAGFVGAAGTWNGNIESEGTIYDMPRIRIGGKVDLATFASRL